MNENFKTIKELADELGITKQTVQYHIKNFSTKVRKKNSRGTILLTEEEQNFIRSRVNKQSDRERSDRERSDREQSDREQSNIEQSDRVQSDRERSDREQSDREQSNREQSNRVQSDREQIYLEKIKFQSEQIADFKEQRVELREQVKHLGVLLDQQQRLALQDKKLLEEYKSEINDLKALKIPLEDTEQKNTRNVQEEVEKLKNQLNSLEEQRLEKQEQEAFKQPLKKWWQLWK